MILSYFSARRSEAQRRGGGFLQLMPHHCEAHPLPWDPLKGVSHTQTAAHMAQQVRKVKPRAIPQSPLNKHTSRTHPGGQSRLARAPVCRPSGAKDDFSGGT